MGEKITYTPQPAHSKLILESKKLDLDAGLLGKCFGSKVNAPFYIAGLLVMVLSVSGIIAAFANSTIPAIEYWKIISPLITLAMGYLFGKGSN